jgi:hypothetical protein
MDLGILGSTKASIVVVIFSLETPYLAFLKPCLGFGMMAHRTAETDLFPTFSAMFGYPDLRFTDRIHKNLVLRATDWGCPATYRKPSAISR